MKSARHEKLGEVLISLGMAGEEDVRRALERQRMQSGRLGTHLLEMGVVSEADVANALSYQTGLQAMLRPVAELDSGLSSRLSAQIARKRNVAPVAWEARRGVITLAVKDPPRLDVLDEIRFACGAKRVEVEIAAETTIRNVIAKVYDGIDPEPVRASSEAGIFSAGFSLKSPSPSQPAREKGGRKKGFAVIADDDRKRSRALASLFEAAGYSTARATGAEEALNLLGKDPSRLLFFHRSLAELKDTSGAFVYDDPAEALIESLSFASSLVEEACALGKEASGLKGEKLARTGSEAVALARLMGARMGLGHLPLSILELKTWRSALAGFMEFEQDDGSPGRELLRAITVYFGALYAGRDRQEAARAVREDGSLNQAAATMLLRWALGADLLTRMDKTGKIVLISGNRDDHAALRNHLADSGWEVVRQDAWVEGEFDALLANLPTGLALLEGWAQSGGAPKLPVFLIADAPSGPDTMYALRLGAEDVFEPGAQPAVIEAKIQRAVSRAGVKDKGGFSGDLQEISFADILQVLSNGSRSCRLDITTPGGNGCVSLENGMVVDGRTENNRGVRAIYEMVGWAEGRFEIKGQAAPEDRTIEGESTEGLLMEGFRLLDESRK